MRFILSALFATALLSTIVAADFKIGQKQQTSFRLEARHQANHARHHHGNKKVRHSQYQRRGTHRRERRSLESDRGAFLSKPASDLVTEDDMAQLENLQVQAQADVIPTIVAVEETVKPKIDDSDVINANSGKEVGVEQQQGTQVVTEAAGVHGLHQKQKSGHHHLHQQQKHHKKVEHQKQFQTQAHEHGTKEHHHHHDYHHCKDHSHHIKVATKHHKTSNHSHSKKIAATSAKTKRSVVKIRKNHKLKSAGKHGKHGKTNQRQPKA
ncbi:hypothetical protein BG004_007435 [Podila humilis]|nr:hypothetical protein BG004_007435 [Podila humilis]